MQCFNACICYYYHYAVASTVYIVAPHLSSKAIKAQNGKIQSGSGIVLASQECTGKCMMMNNKFA